jgi:heat-inducible transcriptional repressor
VQLAPNRLLLVLITDTGRVEQRVVELVTQLTGDEVADLRSLLNSRLAGRALTDAPAVVADLPDTARPEQRPVLTTVITVLLETLIDKKDERVALAGTANLTQSAIDFPTIRPVLEALEENVVLLKLLGEANDPSTVMVRIGEENAVEGPAVDVRRVDRLRPGHRCREHGRRRPHPHGLSEHDHGGAGDRPLRRRAPGRSLTVGD